MLGLPAKTEFNKRIPKQKFYENLSISPALKRFFVDQIRNIYWKNKIAPTTLNIALGQYVSEIEVIEIQLAVSQLDESVLRQIDKEVPYHIVFLLEYEGKYQAWIAYKESAAVGKDSIKVGTYYHTDWMPEQELPLKVDGLNTDAVYESFVRCIAGGDLTQNSTEPLGVLVEKDNRRKKLQQQITNLQDKLRKERQFNKQIEINNRIKELRSEMIELL